MENVTGIHNESNIDDVDYTKWSYSGSPKRKCSNYAKRNGFRHFAEDDDVKAKTPFVPSSIAHCPSETESLETV